MDFSNPFSNYRKTAVFRCSAALTGQHAHFRNLDGDHYVNASMQVFQKSLHGTWPKPSHVSLVLPDWTQSILINANQCSAIFFPSEEWTKLMKLMKCRVWDFGHQPLAFCNIYLQYSTNSTVHSCALGWLLYDLWFCFSPRGHTLLTRGQIFIVLSHMLLDVIKIKLNKDEQQSEPRD